MKQWGYKKTFLSVQARRYMASLIAENQFIHLLTFLITSGRGNVSWDPI